MIKKVAFIGTGVMGYPMVQHLLEANYEVTVYNTNPAKCQGLVEMGAVRAASLKEVAADAEVVFTMLPTEYVVRDVLLKEDGVLAGAKPGTIFVNSSTVSPASNVALGAELEARGFRFLDSPVTGSGLQAQAGTLLFIVGGDEAIYEDLKPLYDAMGKGSLYAGPKVGSASYAKVCSNAMMAINMLSFSEAVTMATKAGVDPEVFVKFCAGGGPQSAVADKKISKMVTRNFSPAFRSALMYKDTGLAADMAKELGIPTPMLNLAKEMFNMACLEGYADEDICAVVKCYEKWAGVEVKK